MCPCAGYYCPDSAMKNSSAYPCTAGFYCPGGDRGPSRVCPRGSFCPSGSAFPTPCPPGSFSNTTGTSDCRVCVEGVRCPLPGTESPRLCPRGRFCEEGSISGDMCPVGTYNSMLGLRIEEECVDCPAGRYCNDNGLVEPTGNCSAGYWCKRGATQPSPPGDVTGEICPKGSFCPTGTRTPVGCPPGRLSYYMMCFYLDLLIRYTQVPSLIFLVIEMKTIAVHA